MLYCQWAHEQHGPHLTLDTDSNIVLNARTVEKSKVPCSYLPVINIVYPTPYELSWKFNIRPQLMEIIYDILNSLNRNGTKKVLQ